MEAILKFKIPEDSEEFELVYKSKDIYFVLYDLDNSLRDKIKYESLPEDTVEAYQWVRDYIHRELNEHNCSLDMLS